MKEGADVYRVRDNQRGATLIIVIGVLSLKRRVTRTRVRCVEHRLRELRTQGGSKGPIAAAPPARYMRASARAMRAREMQRAIRAAAYESICRGQHAARVQRTRMSIIGMRGAR